MHRAQGVHGGGATHAHDGRRPRRPWLAAVMAGVAVAGCAPALVVRPDTTTGAECVRVDAVQEERDNPRAPGVVLVLVTHSLDCLHPRSPGDVVSVSDSERYPKGQHAFSAETLRAEGEPFIRSATFTPVR